MQAQARTTVQTTVQTRRKGRGEGLGVNSPKRRKERVRCGNEQGLQTDTHAGEERGHRGEEQPGRPFQGPLGAAATCVSTVPLRVVLVAVEGMAQAVDGRAQHAEQLDA